MIETTIAKLLEAAEEAAEQMKEDDDRPMFEVLSEGIITVEWTESHT